MVVWFLDVLVRATQDNHRLGYFHCFVYHHCASAGYVHLRSVLLEQEGHQPLAQVARLQGRRIRTNHFGDCLWQIWYLCHSLSLSRIFFHGPQHLLASRLSFACVPFFSAPHITLPLFLGTSHLFCLPKSIYLNLFTCIMKLKELEQQ